MKIGSCRGAAVAVLAPEVATAISVEKTGGGKKICGTMSALEVIASRAIKG